MLPNTFSFVDVETTGTNTLYNRIIEIGILQVQNGKPIKKYQQLINPQTHIDPFIESLTGIKLADLENAPTFSLVKDEIYEILKDTIFVAHNVRFDYSFLRNEFRRFDVSLKLKHFCTIKLARVLYPGLSKYNLDAIIERFGIKCANRHRAYDDAQVLWHFYKKAKQEIDATKFEKAIDTVLKKPSVPIHISIGVIDELPESPGVYIFYGENDLVLYVGKSINIHDRILDHFANDHFSPKDMKLSQQVLRIETIPTAGELGALLLESSLVKKHQPVFNRQLRNKRQMTVIIKNKTKQGYNTIKFQSLEDIDLKDVNRILGVFKTEKIATDFLYETAKKHQLCPKLLTLDKSKSNCFYYQLKLCNGACLGKELNLKYNLRFDEAFYKHKVKSWNFPGPIMLKETGDKEEIFIVDKWCLLGNYKDEAQLVDQPFKYSFDYDTYKILHKFIQKPHSSLQIKYINLPQTSEVNSEFVDNY